MAALEAGDRFDCDSKGQLQIVRLLKRQKSGRVESTEVSKQGAVSKQRGWRICGVVRNFELRSSSSSSSSPPQRRAEPSRGRRCDAPQDTLSGD
jgi:hypothetical protein